MEEQNNWTSGFEFVDIEIIDHKAEDSPRKWNCDQCSLFYLSHENLVEHKKKHMNNSEVKCLYCNKVLSVSEESRECYTNKKCETCEYRCSQCPQRFLRHSSLMNHENNHSKQKNKKSTAPKSGNKQIRGNTPKRGNNQHNLESLNSTASESGMPSKRKRNPSISPRKRARPQTDIPLAESNNSDDDIETCNSSTSKRSSLKPNKKIKEKNNLKLTKQSKEKLPSTKIISTTDTQASTSSNVNRNSVNYKPFSCHICNDNFASENILLEHIQSHGDAAKSFKCKFCAEEFETIYDIQYHLAVCPLAEDELESTLKNSTPPKFLKKLPNSLTATATKRKRGRPKKISDNLLNCIEDTVIEDPAKVAEPLVTRRNKRKSYAKSTEPLTKNPKVTFSPVPNRRKKLPVLVQETSPINEVNNIGFDSDQSNVSENGALGDINSENLNDRFNESFETDVENQKKHNICPFPRCGMKFTREKALECHMRNHNDDFDDTLKCHKCDIPFDDIKSLRIHVDECQGLKEERDDDFSGPKQIKTERQNIKTTHKSGGDFQSKTGRRIYHTEQKLKRHMAGHSSSNFVCRICKDVFANQTLLDQHFLDLHPTKTSHHCVTCKEDFISELFLQIHVTEYHDSTPPKRLSKQGSKSQIETKSHIKKNSIDSKDCNNSGYLKDVVSNTLSKRDHNLLWCPVCFDSFDKREHLRDHFRSSHTTGSGSVYVCELCDIEKPSAEMLCWHLEVHSNNTLSVNRFSKLRTCVSNIKKKDIENNKQSPKAALNLSTNETSKGTKKTKTKSNNLNRIKMEEELQKGNSCTQKTGLTTCNISNPEKNGCHKENTTKQVISGRLKLHHNKKQKRLLLQLKAKSLERSKLKHLSSNQLLLQADIANKPHVVNEDETVRDNFIKVKDGSESNTATSTAKDKSSHKPEVNEGNFIKKLHIEAKAKTRIHKTKNTNHENSDKDNRSGDGVNKICSDKVDSISDKILGEGISFIEVEPTNNTIISQSSEIVPHHDRKNLSSQNTNKDLPCQDDSHSPFEAKDNELSVHSHKDKEQNVSSDLMNNSLLDYFDISEKQPEVAKSILSKKGKCRFRNLRSSFPTKDKKLKKTEEPLKTYKDSNLIFDNQENNKSILYNNAESNLTAEDESSLVAIANAETFLSLSSPTHLQFDNIKESSPSKIKLYSTNNKDQKICDENPKDVLNGTKNSDCQIIVANNVKIEVPVLTTNKNSADKKASNEIPTSDCSKNTHATCESSNMGSKTFHSEIEESNKKKIYVKSMLQNSSATNESKVTEILTNIESNSDKDGFCGANNVVLESAPKNNYTMEIVKEKYVSKKSSTFDNPQGTTSKKPGLVESEEHSQSESAVFKNLLEEHNDSPTNDCSSSLREDKTTSTRLQENDNKGGQIIEDSTNEANKLFEEVSCDKCSLKFYNQDDLFDHIGSHYDI